jgi:hypothetical protein
MICICTIYTTRAIICYILYDVNENRASGASNTELGAGKSAVGSVAAAASRARLQSSTPGCSVRSNDSYSDSDA